MTTLLFHLALLFLSSTCVALNSSQNGTGHVEHPKNRLYNPLVCYVETEGELYGQNYHESQRHEPCGPDVKYCQKVTAHFIAAGGQVTKITMKGCDTVELLPHYAGLECKGNGCSERTEGDEIYNVCCCNTETCNPASRSFSILVIISLLICFFL